MATIRRYVTHCSFVLAALGMLMLAPAVPADAQAVMSRPPAAGTNTLELTQQGFRQVYTSVAPAVVQITSVSGARSSSSRSLFEEFFGLPQQAQTERSSGSGVIIRSDGIVLTNSHVVRGATRVSVKLHNRDGVVPAEVVQTDPRTDLAIVRITEPGTYPTARLGDASTVQVGDWAIAIGSPFSRFTSTMTVGIISATGRQLRSPNQDYTFEDLLQTDASINPGNSGGPLVNIRGEIVGINFMIYSPGDSSGNIGIGFAIPINENTKRVIETLSAGRAVERGRIGAVVAELDPVMREAFKLPEERGGIFVQSVVVGLAAEKAGIKSEDIILEFNGKPVTSVKEFIEMVERTQPGTRVPVTIFRDGRRQSVTVMTGSDAVSSSPDAEQKRFGLTVAAITPRMVESYRLPVREGVVITRVEPDGVAEQAGFEVGDVILRVGNDRIASTDEFWVSLSKAMAVAKRGVAMRVQRGVFQLTLGLPVPKE